MKPGKPNAMDEWERERWRGEIDSELKTIKEMLKELKDSFRGHEKDLGDLKLIVKGLSTKMTGYAALGAFVGGGIMSFIVGIFLRH